MKFETYQPRIARQYNVLKLKLAVKKVGHKVIVISVMSYRYDYFEFDNIHFL